MEIRQATGSDVSAVKRVAEQSWENDYPEFVSRETIDDTVEDWYAEEKLRDVIESDDAEIFVADDEGIAGFAHAVWDETEGDILRLYVTPESRREGVGRQLLARFGTNCSGETSTESARWCSRRTNSATRSTRNTASRSPAKTRRR